MIFQGLSGAQPPRDLNSLLVEIRVPEDIEQSPWAKQFREHLNNQPEKEAMFDFVIVCNVLRSKETEVKQIARGMKWRLTELNKDRRDLLNLIGQSFFSEGDFFNLHNKFTQPLAQLSVYQFHN